MVVSASDNNHRSNANVPRSSSHRPSSSTNKPSYQKIGTNSLKKIKFHSRSCDDNSKQERIFLKLDPNNKQQAKKIQQRRKAIAKGKNTIGYDIYCRSIPKDKRQKRSMVTPSTPDHTIDIPNKKWNGMVRSWRIALHRYDPVDLQQSFAAAQEAALIERQNVSRPSADNGALTSKEKEIANSGVSELVHVTTNSNNDDTDVNTSLRQVELFSPRSTSANEVLENAPFATPEDDHGSKEVGILSELNRWEAARQEDECATFFSGGEDDDSDDDLL